MPFFVIFSLNFLLEVLAGLLGEGVDGWLEKSQIYYDESKRALCMNIYAIHVDLSAREGQVCEGGGIGNAPTSDQM